MPWRCWCWPKPARKLGRTLPQPIWPRPDVRAVAAAMTVACATDGNHGRSVAWGAQTAGCRAVIFIHAGVSQSRADAMAAFGAEIRRIDGSYDDSVRIAAETAAKEGWTVVSDTSWEGYEAIPLTVMQGYTATIGEALDALPSRRRISSCRPASAASPRPSRPMPASGSGRSRRRSSSSSRSAPPACSPAPRQASR